MTYSLLSNPTDNPKVSKNIGYGVLTAPLHLAPHKLSGYNVCPMASLGCIKACLHTAGNPAYMKGKNTARIRKTIQYFEKRDEFMNLLVKDIAKLEKKSLSLGLKCGVRLNATSDIIWESVPVEYLGKRYKNVMELFPNVQFYDYSKHHKRKDLPNNYHLTYSLAEDNEDRAEIALNNGMNVAVVFRKPELPEKFTIGKTIVDVINGDLHDYRPADGKYPVGKVIGLKAKGQAKKDTTGFVKENSNAV